MLREAWSKLEEARSLLEDISPTPMSPDLGREVGKEVGAYYMIQHAIEMVRAELRAIEGE